MIIFILILPFRVILVILLNVADMLNEAAQLLSAVEAERLALQEQLVDKDKTIELLMQSASDGGQAFMESMKKGKEEADLRLQEQAREIEQLKSTIDDMMKVADESESTMAQLDIQLKAAEDIKR